MMFGNPIWLWGLTGLLIPIGIHLLSRKEGKVIRFGSLRHLQETPTQQFKHIHLNDLLQLLLRCLIVLVLILLLADLRIASSTNKKWILIEPMTTLPSTVQSWVDSLKDADVEIRAFHQGFPLLQEQSVAVDSTSYWKLIQDLNTLSLDKVYIISKTHFNQFTGERKALPDFVTWIPLEQPEITFIQSVKRTSTDSLLVTVGKSNPQITTFRANLEYVPQHQNLYQDSIRIQSQDTLTIALYVDAPFKPMANIIEAALYTLAKKANIFLVLSKNELPAQSSTNHWLIWLSTEPPVDYGKNKLLLHELFDNDLILQVSTHEWFLTKPISEEDILNNHLLVQLSQLFLKPIDETPLYDVRAMPEPVLWGSASISQKRTPTERNSLEKILAFLLLAFVAAERLIAHKRNA